MVTEMNEDELINANNTRYNTFDYHKPDRQKMSANMFCYYFISTLIVIALNSTGLYIGVDYKNATCYENQKIISLSSWLIISTSCFLVYQIYYIILLTIALYGCEIPNYKEFYICNVSLLVFMIIGISVFKIVMFIIGIIELTHQYPTCYVEVYPVTTMSIVFTVINALYYASMLR